MLVSGSIGITILSKQFSTGQKIIIILSDSHSHTNYCSFVNKDNKSIGEFFDSIKNKQLLIEEIPKTNKQILINEMWTDVPHVKEVRKYFLENSKSAEAIDIRFDFVPFTIELANTDEQFKRYLLKDYLSEINLFFNGKGSIYEKYFKNFFENDLQIFNINGDKSNDIKKNIVKYFKNMKKFYESFQKLNDSTLGELDNTILYYIEILINRIMEFYVTLKLLSTLDTSIIHMGLYHTSNIIDILLKHHKFYIVYQNGINKFPPLVDDNNIISCIKIPDLKKFGIN